MLAPSLPDGKASGLNAGAAVQCEKRFTLHEALVHKQIGVRSAALMPKGDEWLKAGLELAEVGHF